MVAKSSAGHTSTKELVTRILSNSFVIAVILGLGLNLLGFYEMLSNSAYIDIYTNTVNTVTGPIVGMILFIIGYNLKINMDTIGSLLKLLTLRIVLYIGVIVGFFVLFPDMMADKIYMMAVLIYFMCPTGFALPMQISPLFKSDEDSSYTSALISLNMIVTLVVYTIIVVFVA